MISMSDIHIDGTIAFELQRLTIYQTPRYPYFYDANKWVYHEMPDLLTLQNDMLAQQKSHQKIGAHHVLFDFPENHKPDAKVMQWLRAHQFQLGCVELYAIEGKQLASLTDMFITLKQVDKTSVKDYFQLFNTMSQVYGEDYVKESNKRIETNLAHGTLNYYVAYENKQPVGIVNLIEKEESIEIDGFAVDERLQKQGIGRRMQAQIGKIAGDRPVILVADAEDTVKDMYVKQGYTYISFRYSALLEEA